MIISLGCNCYVSWTLRRLALQDKTYPWDWINSSNFSGIIETINTGFSPVFEHIVLSKFKEDLDKNTTFLSNSYFFRFPHEYDVNEEISIEDIVEKYNRRYERFRNLLRFTNEPLLFVRLKEYGYGDFPMENDSLYDQYIPRFLQYFDVNFPGKDFKILLMDKKIGNILCNDSRVLCLNNVVPFENGFYNFDVKYPTQEKFFAYYKYFFNYINCNWNELKGDFGSRVLNEFLIDSQKI